MPAGLAETASPKPQRRRAWLWSDACRQGWITPPILIGREAPARKPVMTIDELLRNLQRE
jgi:hypothetical protein